MDFLLTYQSLVFRRNETHCQKLMWEGYQSGVGPTGGFKVDKHWPGLALSQIILHYSQIDAGDGDSEAVLARLLMALQPPPVHERGRWSEEANRGRQRAGEPQVRCEVLAPADN